MHPFALTEPVPSSPDHPGSFGFVRKNHIHEGVDLYCEEGTSVCAIKGGMVVNVIAAFTGPEAGSPWWNTTGAVMVEDEDGVWLYGEIRPNPDLIVGSAISAGEWVGGVSQVLRKNKGRPMSMLHVERYVSGTTEPVEEWPLNSPQPEGLLDPTPGLLAVYREDF